LCVRMRIPGDANPILGNVLDRFRECFEVCNIFALPRTL
jgi:hypothetical protein